MFFDEPYLDLPEKAQYYFNILIISIAISPQYAQEIFQNKAISLWDIQGVNDPRPIAIHIYTSYHINKDLIMKYSVFLTRYQKLMKMKYLSMK